MRLSLFLGLAALVVPQAIAQTTLGRIVGTVQDQTGARLASATVTITNEATNQRQSVVTGNDGRFVFPQIPVGSYLVKVAVPGFKTASYSNVKVDAGQEYSLTAALQVGDVTEVIEVTTGADLVHTTTTEITNTVTQRQMLELPLNGRNPIELIRLQAGVTGIVTRTNTAINGGRPSWTQITQDGINIQDNFIRTNSLDFVPNRPTPDNVAEFSIITNTQGVDATGGSSQVKLVTPSGGNEFHGSVYEFNRHSRFGANSWFNNRDGIERPKLKRNQFGGRLSGPIVRNRLFFFAYYEGFRQPAEDTQNNVVPRNDDLLSGVFRYRPPTADPNAPPQSVNILQLVGLSIDPQIRSRILTRLPAASLVNNGDVGDGINTGGYRFNQTDDRSRNHFGGRLDYELNQRHHFEVSLHRFSEVDDRTDLDRFNLKPKVFTDATTKLIAGAWRWQASSTFQNELRVGANLAPVAFETTEDYGDALFNLPLSFRNPVVTFQPQGRDTRTRQFTDSASWVTGRHSVQFGASLQQIRVNPYNFAGQFPTVSLGFSLAAPAGIQLRAAHFPGGIASADLGRANAHLAFLAGVISQVTQTFQVKDKASGFVSGIPNDRNYTFDNYGVYLQDSWNIRPHLTLRAGLKWEYYTPLKEDNDLALVPVLGGRNIRDVVLSPVGSLDFARGGLYKSDWNNIAPSIGIAWDPFKDGKTSVRAGYTKAFVNEETIVAGRNAVNQNPGLDTPAALRNLYTTVASGVPQVPTPSFKVPRTFADQAALSATSVVFSIDPDLKHASVHQFSLSFERELRWDLALELRYIANVGRNLYRGIDLNQVKITPEFLDDFLRARRNGFLALQQTGSFNPAYNPAIPGSQPLTVIPRFGGGSLTDSTVIDLIQTGQVAGLADRYVLNRVPGAREAFLPNPGIYAADLIVNGGETDYHGLQLELRRRFRGGFFGQVNYTFSKTLSNSFGDGQTRFEPLLDNARPELEKARAPFDTTHIMNANFVYELPFGEGKRWLNGGELLDRIVGGWRIGSIVHWQSGSPFSILSGRFTINRDGRSGKNTANSSLTRKEIKKLLGLRKDVPCVNDKSKRCVYYIDPNVIHSSGRAVGPDNLGNTAGFPGQVFFNPPAGQPGMLQRLQFDGPSQFSWDMSLMKRTKIAGRFDTELRIDAFNVLNSPYFYVDDDNFSINSTAFGKVTELNQNPRVIQIAIKLNF